MIFVAKKPSSHKKLVSLSVTIFFFKRKNMKYNRIAIKIGSNVLTKSDGTLDILRMESLVEQIATLYHKGVEIILISSGAVANGRDVLKLDKKLDSVSARQVFSAVGQARLINRYYDLFAKHNIVCGQVLTTKESLSTRQFYLNQKNCISEMLACGVIPIVNENDTISVTELMFTDNDELSGLIATMMKMQALIILSNIDGIYTGDPSDPKNEVIREILPEKNLSQYIQTNKSSFGRGGMLTKCNIARKVADEGICVIIANGKKDNILPDLLNETKNVVCSTFIPNSKETTNIKKWIAHSQGFTKGEVYINEGASNALLNSHCSSLLFVGITKINGDFEKGDIVKIFNHKGKELGVGKAQFSNKKAQQHIGKHGLKPFIHYDYMYLE